MGVFCQTVFFKANFNGARVNLHLVTAKMVLTTPDMSKNHSQTMEEKKIAFYHI